MNGEDEYGIARAMIPLLTTIPREKGLDQQNFRCASCNRSIGPTFASYMSVGCYLVFLCCFGLVPQVCFDPLQPHNFVWYRRFVLPNSFSSNFAFRCDRNTLQRDFSNKFDPFVCAHWMLLLNSYIPVRTSTAKISSAFDYINYIIELPAAIFSGLL